jgi:hypothetical protein
MDNYRLPLVALLGLTGLLLGYSVLFAPGGAAPARSS